MSALRAVASGWAPAILQLMCKHNGGTVEEADEGEYGRAQIRIVKQDAMLFQGLAKESDAWMSHRDKVTKLPPGCVSATAILPTSVSQ